MNKLDRLGWVAGFSFDAYGTRIGVRTNNAAILEELRMRLPIGWKQVTDNRVETIYSLKVGGAGSRPGLKQYHLLYNNITRLTRTFDLDMALDTFENSIQLLVAEMASNRVFVHAGVIAWQGKAIMIPGRSMSGKSSLVRAFLKEGATYYSDEYALIDKKGRVHPYLLPISVGRKIGERQARVPATGIGATQGKKPLPVGLVLVTNYSKGAHWRPKQIPAGQGLLSILANTVSAQRNPAKALATLQQVVLKAPVLKGVRGETDEVVDALLNRPWPTL